MPVLICCTISGRYIDVVFKSVIDALLSLKVVHNFCTVRRSGSVPRSSKSNHTDGGIQFLTRSTIIMSVRHLGNLYFAENPRIPSSDKDIFYVHSLGDAG